MNCYNCNIDTQNPKFCSRTCAAIFTNKIKPKRPRVIKHCNKCGAIAPYRRKYCEGCRTTSPTLSLSKGQAITNDTQRYRRIRSSARIIAKAAGLLDSCKICGYSLYVEACHIRPIKNFPDTALLSEINSIENLVGLCPNHHWEFDNGYLSL